MSHIKVENEEIFIDGVLKTEKYTIVNTLFKTRREYDYEDAREIYLQLKPHFGHLDEKKDCGSCSMPEIYRNGLCKGCYKGEMKFEEDNDK